MQKILNIGKIAGIPVRLHWTFGLIFLLVIYVGQKSGFSLNGFFVFGALVLTNFGCVLLHELGHALAARRYGVNTHDIILTPIGGIARLEDIPRKPLHEFVVAIAGPLVNVAIALLLAIGLWCFRAEPFGFMGEEDTIFNYWENFVPILCFMNVTLPIFNMIPAFPMDGGRVLRALLSVRLKRPLATKIAARLGQMMAIGFLTLGIWQEQYSLILIGLFVFWSAEGELRAVRTEDALATTKIGDVCRRNFTVFHEEDGMSVVFNEFRKEIERNFLVFNASRDVMGVLYDSHITDAMDKKMWDACAGDQSITHFDRLQKDDVMKTAHDKMAQHGYAIMPVYDENYNLYGVLDLTSMNDFMIQQRSIF